MAQDKKVFTGGMDKDSDPRLIKGGDYRDALNIRNVSSSDSTSGSVENIEGNTLVPFNFIDETDQLIEVTPTGGDVYVDEIDTSQVFNQVNIEIDGRELVGYVFNFSLGYLTTNGDENLIAFSPINWSASTSQTNTSTTLYNNFGPGGPLSVIQVDDLITGLPITLVAEIDFESGDALDGSGIIFNITYTCTQAGATFSLYADSSYTVPEVVFGSVAFSDPIGVCQNDVITIGGSVSSVNATGDLGGNVDDQGNVFGPGGGINTGSTIIDLEITGDSPTSNSETVVEDVTLFSYTQAGGDGSNANDWLIETAIDLSTANESFGSGGEFEFDSGQDSIAGFLTDIVTDDTKLNNILVDGGNGTVTSLGDISTNFLAGTKLEGNNSSIGRNSPSDASYSQLEYFYDSTEVIEGDGFSINEGTLTFSGTDILAGNTYPLKTSIIEDKNYLLSFTLSGLPDGVSLNFNAGNQSFPSQGVNGIKSFVINPENNASIIYITFNKNFTSSNEVTITNLRLFLEDIPVDIFSIRLASIGSTRFNLAFASSEEKLRKDLVEGKQSTQIREWFPGVALSLVTKNVGDGYGVIAGVQLADLQEDLLEALGNISSLTSTIASLTADHSAELAALTLQLVDATDNAAQIQTQLETANALNVTLETELASINGHINNFLESQEEFAGLDSITAYLGTSASISASLSSVSAAITNFDIAHIAGNNVLNVTIQDQISDINDLNVQIAAQILTIETQSQQIFDLTDLHTTSQESLTASQLALSQMSTSFTNLVIENTQENLILVATHDAEVLGLEQDYTSLQTELATALANQEDGVSQADVDAVQSKLSALTISSAITESTLEELTNLFNQATLDLEISQQNTAETVVLLNAANASIASITPEDGISQADVDAVQALLDAVTHEDGISQADLDAMQVSFDLEVAALSGSHQTEVNAIQALLDAIVPEDGVSQSDVDAVQALLDAVVPEDGVSQSDVDAVQALLDAVVPEDGISQDDLDILESQLEAVNVQLDAINEELANNPTIIDSTEHVKDPRLEDPSQWGPTDVWIFNDGGGISHAGLGNGLLSGIPVNNEFGIPLIDVGSYIFSFNITDYQTGSVSHSNYVLVRVTYNDSYPFSTENLVVAHSAGRFIKTVNFTTRVRKIDMFVSGAVISLDISELSIVSVTSAVTVSNTLINNLLTFTEELTTNNDLLISLNEGLATSIEESSEDLATANQEISLFSDHVSSMSGSLSTLGTSVLDAIALLGTSSNITQGTIDDFITDFNEENNSLSDEVSALTDLINYLTSEIDLIEDPSGGSGGSGGSENDKWLFTFSGGVPVNVSSTYPDTKNLVIKNSDSSFEDFTYQIYGWDDANFMRGGYLAGDDDGIANQDVISFLQNHHPLYKFLKEVIVNAGGINYDSNLRLQSDETAVITFSASFHIESHNASQVNNLLKITVHNLLGVGSVIDTSGNPYTSTSSGDRIIGNQGDIPLEKDPNKFLENSGVSDGIQIEIEALGEASGWEFYIQEGFDTLTQEKLNSQSSHTLFSDSSSISQPYGWNISNPSDPNYLAPDGVDFKMHVEKIQSIPNQSLDRSTEGSAGSFIAAAAAPNFSIDSMAVSDELIYPAQTADIIVNKSKDVPPNLGGNTFGAKRFVRNTILNKTTVRDNSSSSYKCIGTYEDKPKNSIYYLVHHSSNTDKFDCILEYSLIDNKIRTVYQDGRQGSNGLSEGILNFDLDHAITGVNKVDDILYWTDNLNRPRKINVNLGKKNEVNINKAIKFEDVNFPGSHSNSVFLTYNDTALKSKYSIGDTVYTHTQAGEEATAYNGYAEVLGIVRNMPAGLTFNTTDGSNEVISSSALGSNDLEPGEWIGIMDSTNFPRFYQVADISGTTITTVSPVTFTLSAALALYLLPSGGNIGGLLTNCPFQSFSAIPGLIMSADPSDAYSPLISFGKYEDKMRYFDVIKHQPLKRPVTVLATDTSYAKNNILDTLFQFKYRYSHQDNENTSYSSISNINIDPEFARNTPLKHSEYRETANTIEVEYFDTISDVKKIEITTRKGNDGEFTLVDTVQNNFIRYLKSLKNEVIVDPDYYFVIPKSIIKFRNNGVYPFINKSEGDKLFDAVPKLAKAQTIISDNRLTYGNILEGYDNTPLVVSSSFNADGPIIQNNESNFLVYSLATGGSQITSINVDDNAAANSVLGQELTGTSEPNIWQPGANKNCKVHFFIDFAGMNLNQENSQTLSIDLSFHVARRSAAGKAKKRAGRFAMNLDITGLDTINQVRNKVISQFNQDNWEGGTKMQTGDPGTADISDCVKNEGGEGEDAADVQCTSSGSSMINVYWKQKKNSTDSNSGAPTVWGDWSKVIQNVSVKLLSGDAGFNTFKTGAFHDFGISYFDETNRCSFVNVAPDYGQDVTLQEGYNTALVSTNLNGTRSYNPFPAEPNGPAIGQASSLKLNIYNKPPSWATSYQVMYAGNTSVDEFMQVTVPHAIPGTGGDTQMYLSLQSLKSHKSSYTEATGALTDFDVAKGDRIRFISCDTTSGRKKFNDYLDFEITGFEFYNEELADVNGNPITVASGQEGFYIRISNPGSDLAQLDGSPDVSINHSGFSLSGSGYDKLIAELYRPKKTQTPESTVYFELGDRLEIGNPGELNNYHTGIVDQTNEYFYDNNLNTMVSLYPAEINLNEGDVYIKSRNMFTETNGVSLEGFPCESYYLNDFHSTNHYDKGRINVVNNNAEERILDTSVYYSEPYVSTGAINGLSSFNLANTPWYDYNKEFGSIQSLQTKDNDLIIFHESKVGRVLVGQDILNTASGEGLISLSNDVISNYATLYSGQFGCGLNPESIVKHGQKFYFADIKRGAILRLSTDGLTVISEYGMKDYFRDLGEMYIKYNPDGIKTFSDSIVGGGKTIVPYLLVGGYDPKYDEYIITFPEIEAGGRNYVAGNASTIKNWSEGILNWDDATLDPNMKNDKILFNAVTLGFSEGTNKWTSFYSFVPDFYSKINKQFVSFKQGRVYRHNDSDLYSRANADFNNFYGNGNLSYIDFVFNADPSRIKSYNAIGLESDTKFITGMFTNIGQHYGNYDDVATTSIAFKKVNGLVTGDAGFNLITGSGTKFYESVTPGDLVRVFGYIKNNYTHRDFIVTKVISNTTISVNENLGIDADDSYMLVIDYKTKEGIQYSNIPFVTSGLSSTEDNFQFGDGSEIQGVGVGTGIDISASYVLFDEVGNVDFNKSIAPINMIVGGEYVINSLAEGSTFNVSDVDPSVNSNIGGTVFTCKTPSSSNTSIVVSTDIKLYVKNLDNTTTFLGYPYTVISTKLFFIPSPSLDNDFSQANKTGFYFTAKSGEVEGEKMKGSYMRTILATNKSQSKKKFNLYAANADVDKSELSNR